VETPGAFPLDLCGQLRRDRLGANPAILHAVPGGTGRLVVGVLKEACRVMSCRVVSCRFEYEFVNYT
jgi:hypothetical protein